MLITKQIQKLFFIKYFRKTVSQMQCMKNNYVTRYPFHKKKTKDECIKVDKEKL